MIHPDAKIWLDDGREMTPIKIIKAYRDKRKIVTSWLANNTVGEYVVTPTYIFFEFGTEATRFRLLFG